MSLTCYRLLRRWSLALGGVLLFAAPGCEKLPEVDRAEYRFDEDFDAETTRSGGVRLSGIRKSTPATAGGKTSHPSVGFTAVQTGGDLPLSQPIATPLPGQIIAASEAEQRPQPAAYAIRPVAPAAPQPAAAGFPSLDVSAAFRQAAERNRNGATSAAKGAWFTARVEFTESLNQLTAALDAREGGPRRSVALAAGLAALTEAESFSPRGMQTAVDPAALAATHKTAPFVGPLAAGSGPPAWHDAYVKYATERLADAVAGCEPGSVALHGLGKVHNAAGETIVDGRSKARAFYQSALAVAPGNFLAANDLAVLLAEEGRLEQARDLLHDALRRSPQPAMWNNLAAVNDRLGRRDLAQLARQESALLERRGAAAPGTVLPTHNVAWLDPRSFAATSHAGAATAPPTPIAPPATARPIVPATPAPAAKPTPGVAQRPINRALAY